MRRVKDRAFPPTQVPSWGPDPAMVADLMFDPPEGSAATVPTVEAAPTERREPALSSSPGADKGSSSQAPADAPQSFLLGDGLSPVPDKLVSKINKVHRDGGPPPE